MQEDTKESLSLDLEMHNAHTLLRFRDQNWIVYVAGLVLQAPGVLLLPSQGSSVAWIGMAVLLCFGPLAWRHALVVVDVVGLKVGGKQIFEWTQVASLDKTKETKLVFTLKNGEQKKVSLFAWPVLKREQFHKLLETIGL